MDSETRKRISKLISLALRHRPERIGITLDEAGWTSVDALLEGLRRHHVSIDLSGLQEIVATSDKQRFAFSADGTRIRANQGHSILVDLGLSAKTPPELLFHGTAEKNVESILRQGLVKMGRLHVHLSPNYETAVRVGQRHGKPRVLQVRSGDMSRNGHVFYLSENGVWLTDNVSPEYLDAKWDIRPFAK